MNMVPCRLSFSYNIVPFYTSRMLFRDDPIIFEPRSGDKEHTWAGTNLSTLPHTPTGERSTLEVRFSTHQAKTKGGSSVESGFEPSTSCSNDETLPLSHRGLADCRHLRYQNCGIKI
ncbi:hypothetical protein AVEN_230788-1 [Araneus ventricosus]|uniref:Uncharacterized protein n=1 Tax=Araneus ventricosus TaxID=182803 RepID=A0A4Y2A375_ARAVE|nr:hypothetical protein AVEN_230788-1 [Araneus ventricosus]